MMPEKGLSSEENLHHAKMLCQYLKVENFTIPINSFSTDYLMLPWKANDVAKMNTKARIRMTILYHYANSFKGLVIGTSNKSELMIGYGTKFGDLAGDIELIGDLFKEEVYQLAEYLSLPTEFIEKAPSAELYSGQTDEQELGFSYKELDHVLKKIAAGSSKEDIISKGMNPNTVHKVFRLIENNRHKTEPTPIISQ
jgi:NAD+ synthase